MRLIAVDNSAEMIEKFRALAAERNAEDPPGGSELRIEHGDILGTKVENASVVVLNFTLQFIDPLRRDELLQAIASGMRPGGVLLVSEKVCFDDPAEQQRQEGWHLDFKRAQGYSELEIARKRDALEQTLRPETMDIHLDRMRRAGFSEVYRWFQCFNFASIVAIR